MAKPGEVESEMARAFFERAKVRVPGGVLKALDEALTDLQAQGAKRAPVDEGFLRGSIEKDPITIRDGILSGAVAARLPYARIQHDSPDFNHPKGGEAFYLSGPLAERSAAYQSNIAKAVQQALHEANR